MRWTLAQFQMQPVKAHVDANIARVVDGLCTAAVRDVALACFPEACLSGYFLQGGVEEVALQADEVVQRLQSGLVAQCPDAMIDVCLGFYERDGGAIYNSALYARLGRDAPGRPVGLAHLHRKIFPPSYGVFDEDRFVTRGRSVECFDTAFGRAAILVCEDAWHSICGTIAALQGAEVILIPSASPGRDLREERPGNVRAWDNVCMMLAGEHGCWVACTDLLGFEGGKAFCGISTVHNPFGQRVSSGPMFEEAMVLTEIDTHDTTVARRRTPLIGGLQETISVLLAQLSSAAGGD